MTPLEATGPKAAPALEGARLDRGAHFAPDGEVQAWPPWKGPKAAGAHPCRCAAVVADARLHANDACAAAPWTAEDSAAVSARGDL